MEKEFFYYIKGQESNDEFVEYEEYKEFVFSDFIFKTEKEAMESLCWCDLAYNILLGIVNNNFELSNESKRSSYVILYTNEGEKKISLSKYEKKEAEMLELLKNTNEVTLQIDELNIVHYTIEILELYTKGADSRYC